MENAEVKRPWHLWVVGILTLLWNSIGILSYLMTQTDNLDGLGMTDDAIAYVQSFPAWADAVWALGVWGAFFGSVLLLFRSRYAVWSLIVAMIGLIGTTVYQRMLTDLPPSMDDKILAATIWIITIGMLIYAKRMTDRGVLN